eukprot:gnl/TRDRNA2_/TRDRNA2_154121_c0_seq2.p1 gnl/TRDRNA2_/TRDRNA2_154121_c0~~gnl/TRDRNA2_/TRDRNA2_154121_c0_seq2.p1  ORF type:complete len:155 (-),score=17.62 gnl/TRDRNA2_/TRDRNA2_154121_c0_seq2:153-554(-)
MFSDDESDDDEDCDIRVAGTLGPIRNPDGTVSKVCDLDACEPARLSHLLSVKASGLPSIGSLDHCKGACKPCVFQSRYHYPSRDADWSKGPCFKGLLCERCHEQHRPVQKYKDTRDRHAKSSWPWRPRRGYRA